MLAEFTIELNETTGLGVILALSALVAIFTCPGEERSTWNKINTIVRFPIWLALMLLAIVLYFIAIIPTFAYHAKRELAFLGSIVIGIGVALFMTMGSPVQLEPFKLVDNPLWFFYAIASVVASVITVGELKDKYSDATGSSLNRAFNKFDPIEKIIRGNLFMKDEKSEST